MRILLQFAKKKSHASVQEGGQVGESSSEDCICLASTGGWAAVSSKACRRKERVIYGFELEEWGPLLGVAAGQTDQRNEQESGHFAVSLFFTSRAPLIFPEV